jgi:hypothetical protein
MSLTSVTQSTLREVGAYDLYETTFAAASFGVTMRS